MSVKGSFVEKMMKLMCLRLVLVVAIAIRHALPVTAFVANLGGHRRASPLASWFGEVPHQPEKPINNYDLIAKYGTVDQDEFASGVYYGKNGDKVKHVYVDNAVNRVRRAAVSPESSGHAYQMLLNLTHVVKNENKDFQNEAFQFQKGLGPYGYTAGGGSSLSDSLAASGIIGGDSRDFLPFSNSHSTMSDGPGGKMYETVDYAISDAVSSPDEIGVDATLNEKEEELDVNELTLWFGTNRRVQEIKSGSLEFTDERAPVTTWGKAKVYVPKSHYNWQLFEKVRAFVTRDVPKVTTKEPLGEDKVFAGIKEYLNQCPGDERQVLFFLHGFCNTFDSAAKRAAQLAADLDMDGRVAFFSWPSKGRFTNAFESPTKLLEALVSLTFATGYMADEASVQASERAIADFLFAFSTKCVDDNDSPVKIHVVAHSMGNRALLGALQKIALDVQNRHDVKNKIKFGQVIFAAPDVDSTVFEDLTQDISTNLPDSIERATLYASDDDKAIQVSAKLHDYPRAGTGKSAKPSDHVDTIKVPNTGGDLIHHHYIAKSKNFLADMRTMMKTNAPPSQREFVFAPYGHPKPTESRSIVWNLRMVEESTNT